MTKTVKVVRRDPGMDAIFWSGAEGEVRTIINWIGTRHGNAGFQPMVLQAIGDNIVEFEKQIKVTSDQGQVYLHPDQWLIEYAPGEFEVCSEKGFATRYSVVGGQV